MPGIDVIAFVLGGALIVIGIVGGGIEVREFKVPAIGRGARSGSIATGVLFVVIGLSGESNVPPTTPSPKPANPPHASVPRVLPRTEVDGRLIQMLSGTWRIQWLFGDVLHDALLYMDGREGLMRVRLADQKTQELKSVDMTMTLEIGDGKVFLFGSDPVVSGTATASADYAADSFRISVVDDHLQFMLCDTLKRCGEVSFQRVKMEGR